MPFFLLSPLLEAGSHVAKAFLYNLLCSQGWSLTYYVAKDNLELLIHLPLSPWCWDYIVYCAYRLVARQTQGFSHAFWTASA